VYFLKQELYTPSRIKIETIYEFWMAGGIHGSYWTEEYAISVIKTAYFTAAYSGKILMWYLYKADELEKSQIEVKNTGACCKVHPEWCDPVHFSGLNAVCNQIKTMTNTDPATETHRGPYFRMIAIAVEKLTHVKESTAGPLVPFFIDSATALLYEARLPGDEAEYVYFSEVHIGQKIKCERESTNPTNPAVPTRETSCEFYVRHIKPVDKFLEGFRQIMYGTVRNFQVIQFLIQYFIKYSYFIFYL
jgi:hypothetical protein